MDADYSISYVSGTLTVTPVALTITADNQTKVYGAALPTLTASYTGFVNGDTAASLTLNPRSAPRPPRASGTGDLCHHRQRRGRSRLHHLVCGRYADRHPGGLTITADNQTKVYGAALPTLTASTRASSTATPLPA